MGNVLAVSQVPVATKTPHGRNREVLCLVSETPRATGRWNMGLVSRKRPARRFSRAGHEKEMGSLLGCRFLGVGQYVIE